MLLAVDIGNSNITFGVFRDNDLISRHSIPTKTVGFFTKCTSEIYKLPYRSHVKDIIITSVVPDALIQLEKIMRRVFKKNIFIVGRNIKVPIINLYNHPQQVGQDRLVNATAAAILYNKRAKKPLIVIDFGTAVTFDCISKRNEYLGGLIFPGIRLSLENLSKRAALLPKIEVKRPNSLIGKDTKDSMRSGLLNGYGSLCDGIIRRVSGKFKTKPVVITTGGDAALIAKYATFIKKIEPDLTLKGLRIIHELKQTHY